MYGIYIVKEGDTLTKIAQQFNIPLEELYLLNSFNPLTIIRVGERIIVPVPKPKIYDYYTVKKGDSIYNVSKMFNITPETLSEINGFDLGEYIYEGQDILVPKKNVNIYVTKKGDSLESVAEKLKSTIAQIVLQNKNVYVMPEQLIITSNQNDFIK